MMAIAFKTIPSKIARQPVALTLYDRCDALHAKMDAVLEATLGVGRIKLEPREVRLTNSRRVNAS